ncbi:putative 2-dehydropantoate 2-reductase [Stutzerimonas degradans]|uniref:putative 2-dehydropantoate 2-reductase n=1 Tax=Stutzerimonas degradans TaxID=2968968 RepID=UPI001423E24F|nr:putative 2-dehydropantoate 2-reductase [Stutzerimonas degradans]MCF6752212.1 putative 2-dehydropantoate 2-reductase [Stutzerimonas stutzeri]NHW01364.1 putative 2-dehydropantoate 2-reductase [Stutzerimonas degradans]
MSESRPRIAIIGTGAIGGYYGMQLALAGHDVHFLLRSEYEAVRERGLRVNSAVLGSQHLANVQAYRSADQLPACDWLFVATKSTATAALLPAIAQVAAPGAKVVLLQNGLAVEDEIRPLLPAGVHLLGGLCAIYAHRSAPGVVEHQALGNINLGYHSGPAEGDEARQAVLAAGAAMLKAAGVGSVTMSSLEQARWIKLVWNVPFNGLSVLLNAGTAALLADTDSRALIRSIMDEVVAAAAACGFTLPSGLADKLIEGTTQLPDYLPSMYHDHAHRRPLELTALYAAPLAAAEQAGCAMPRTQALYRALSFLARHATDRR